MSEAEFASIAALLPAPKRRGRKPTDPQGILNALFYMIRCGSPRPYLPKDFPPFTTLQNRFDAWRDSGLSTQIVAIFVMEAREAEGREAAPTGLVLSHVRTLPQKNVPVAQWPSASSEKQSRRCHG